MGDVEARKRVDRRAVVEWGMRSRREREQESLSGIQREGQGMTRQGRHLAGHHGPFPEQLWTSG